MIHGYVALIDILGFSNMVSSDRDGSFLQKYLESLNAVLEYKTVPYVVFSDSIVLTIEGTESEKLLTLSQACSSLAAGLISHGFPVRGAIVCGSFVRGPVIDGRSVFVAGKAIVDAYSYERALDCVGIILAPSALSQIEELNPAARCARSDPGLELFQTVSDLEWPACIQKWDGIPFKGDGGVEDFNSYGIVPGGSRTDPSVTVPVLKVVANRLAWLQSIAPSPAAQRKYAATLKWISDVTWYWENKLGSAYKQFQQANASGRR